jgi:hypothetical protein
MGIISELETRLSCSRPVTATFAQAKNSSPRKENITAYRVIVLFLVKVQIYADIDLLDLCQDYLPKLTFR